MSTLLCWPLAIWPLQHRRMTQMTGAHVCEVDVGRVDGGAFPSVAVPGVADEWIVCVCSGRVRDTDRVFVFGIDGLVSAGTQ